MIYPVLSNFEWALVGLASIAVLIWGIKSIVWESRPSKPHDYAHDEEFHKRMEEEQAKVDEYYNKIKTDWEKRNGRSWDEWIL